MSTNHETWQSVAVESPSRVASIDEGIFYHYESEGVPADNPFQTNNYDFDDGFYQGDFEYTDPLNQQTAVGTPERYGRQRIAAFLSNSLRANAHDATILDIGSGMADIARALPSADRTATQVVLADISGPWTELAEESLLVKGWQRLRSQPSYAGVINIQCDLNETAWPFKDEAFDYIISSMALHHIRADRKNEVAQSIHSSLKPGGLLVITDVFDYNRDRIALTSAGEKGPEECSGSPEPIRATLERLEHIGFTVLGPHLTIGEDDIPFSPGQVRDAVDNLGYMLPVNRAVWYLVAQKLLEQ